MTTQFNIGDRVISPVWGRGIVLDVLEFNSIIPRRLYLYVTVQWDAGNVNAVDVRFDADLILESQLEEI